MRPNLLFINLDQQRFDCLGHTGNAIVKTPHIDRLAASGMRFNAAYTPIPLCCPARQTLLCGQMPDRHGGLWNYDICSPIPGLSPDVVTWPKRLTAEGYNCAYLGKWHVHPDCDGTHYGYRSHREALPLWEESRLRRIHTIKQAGLSFGVGLMEDVPLAQAHTHRLADMAIREMEQMVQAGDPWHLRVDFFEPHLPCYCAREFAERYNPADIPPWPNFAETFKNKPYIQRQQLENWGLADWTWREWAVYLSAYYGMISQVDDAIGRIVSYLEATGASDNTILIFTTDHGDAAGSHRMMDKHYVMYEEEVHVPLIVCWPGKVAAGSQCDDFIVHYLDLPPTLLAAIDLEPEAAFQGKSFLPQLLGRENPAAREYAFSSYNGQQFGLFTQRMIRDRQFKYVWNATDVDELYDMQSDPFEMNNLALDESQAQRLSQYRQMLCNCFSELQDPMIEGNLWVQKYFESNS